MFGLRFDTRRSWSPFFECWASLAHVSWFPCRKLFHVSVQFHFCGVWLSVFEDIVTMWPHQHLHLACDRAATGLISQTLGRRAPSSETACAAAVTSAEVDALSAFFEMPPAWNVSMDGFCFLLLRRRSGKEKNQTLGLRSLFFSC